MFQSVLSHFFKYRIRIQKMQIFKFSTLNKFNIEKLKFRTLLRVSGTEVTEFLQGLITNDVKHLEKNSSMYTMFLNTKGRVLYDTIIYKIQEQTYFIECDLRIINELTKHLKMYRVRRKIDIVDINNEYNIWVVFNPNIVNIQFKNGNEGIQLEENLISHLPTNKIIKENHNEFMLYKDPRMLSLGIRILTSSNLGLNDIQNYINIKNNLHNEVTYKLIRYKLGVGEGIDELPPGKSFPLEANCDYLHGVSFHKGCYIGQELTARTHHTGVVRKRLMPIFFKSNLHSVPDLDTTIMTADDKKLNIGKFRGVEKDVGLGLLRVDQALQSEEIKIANVTGVTMKPHWWPIEAPKEVTSLGKN